MSVSEKPAVPLKTDRITEGRQLGAPFFSETVDAVTQDEMPCKLYSVFQAFSSDKSFLASADCVGCEFSWLMTWSVTSQETRISSTQIPK